MRGSVNTLGTDGLGRSASRATLRDHFEVDANFIVYTTLYLLVENGKLDKKVLNEAIAKFKINPNKINPLYA